MIREGSINLQPLQVLGPRYRSHSCYCHSVYVGDWISVRLIWVRGLASSLERIGVSELSLDHCLPDEHLHLH
jgi:hypothetical protein